MDELRTSSIFDSSERRSDGDQPSVEELESALEENSSAQMEVLEQFKPFYGESEAQAQFNQVKANYAQYSRDDRPIFKVLSDLEKDRRRLQNELVLTKKRAEYSSMSLEDLTSTVMKLEARLLKSENSSKQRPNNYLTGKHLLVVGGHYFNSLRQHTDTGHCISIDLDSGENVQLRELQTGRSLPAVVAVGARVYVAGGATVAGVGTRSETAWTWTQAFEVYDYVSERWDTLPNIPEVLSSVQGCSHGSNVIIWGMTRSATTLAIFIFETSRNTWENIPPPPVSLPTVPDKQPTERDVKAPAPWFGCVGKWLFFFESSGRKHHLSLYDLDDPNPRWQGDCFKDSNDARIPDDARIQSLFFLLEQHRREPDSWFSRGDVATGAVGVSSGTGLAIPKAPCRCEVCREKKHCVHGDRGLFQNHGPKLRSTSYDLSYTGIFRIYDSRTGFVSELKGDDGEQLIAFAHDVAILGPPSHIHRRRIRINIPSSQAKRYMKLHFEKENQWIRDFSAVIVDLMEGNGDNETGEIGPS